MRLFSLVVICLTLPHLLSSQEVADAWNRSFAIPHIEKQGSEGILAIAVEGDEIAVATREGIYIYRDGQWGGLIGYDTVGRPFSGFGPNGNLGLFRGEPWIAGSGGIFRHDGETWKKMPSPARKP